MPQNKKKDVDILPYTNGFEQIEKDGTKYVRSKYGSVKIQRQYVKTYIEGIEAMVKICDCNIALVLYLQLCTYKEQVFQNDYLMRSNFNGWVYGIRGSVFQDNTIQGSIKRLKKEGMLIQYKKGKYKTNPAMFWNGTTDDRHGLLSAQSRKDNDK